LLSLSKSLARDAIFGLPTCKRQIIKALLHKRIWKWILCNRIFWPVSNALATAENYTSTHCESSTELAVESQKLTLITWDQKKNRFLHSWRQEVQNFNWKYGWSSASWPLKIEWLNSNIVNAYLNLSAGLQNSIL
jgi:hypothetical protein